jgi:hypothetical protein
MPLSVTMDRRRSPGRSSRSLMTCSMIFREPSGTGSWRECPPFGMSFHENGVSLPDHRFVVSTIVRWIVTERCPRVKLPRLPGAARVMPRSSPHRTPTSPWTTAWARHQFAAPLSQKRAWDLPQTRSDLQFLGGAEGTRTPDPLHAMQMRYQLRHSPIALKYFG